jgi:S-(hydroxymethyl)glutathione dehydrogenase/alcohol dehydrogenase
MGARQSRLGEERHLAVPQRTNLQDGRALVMSRGIRARAAIPFERGEPLRIEEIRVRDPGPGHVRVRIAACGICASDLHVWRTGEGIGFPAVLGHEASGVVEATGADVTEVSEGQGVVLAWIPRCGICRSCRAGRTHLCAAMRTDGDDGSLLLAGTSLGRYMSIAGLSERVVVGERAAIPVPEGLSLCTVCTIGCGVTTGVDRAFKRSFRDVR